MILILLFGKLIIKYTQIFHKIGSNFLTNTAAVIINNKDCKMEQHYQVINLHNIIRSQQAKLQQLRQELRVTNEREETRYVQFVKNYQVTLTQKQKMIEFLKEELKKAQSNRSVESYQVSDRLEKQKQRLDRELMMYKKKCIELEGKNKRMQNQYEIQIENINEQNKKIKEQIGKYQQSKTNLTVQITKLNHFYKNSLFDIGKRKETLLWVDKFTEYLETSEAREKRTLQDVSNFVKSQVNSLKTSLAQMVSQVGKNESEIYGNKNHISEQLNKNIKKIKDQCYKILSENDEFWNNSIKMQKQSQRNEEIKNLQTELIRTSEKHRNQTQNLKNLLKTTENDKKTLILGFQQLKSLTEHRQNLYRQEITHLKKTIEELIETGTQRDKQFENQIKILTNQIQNISQRYYENIENPMKKVNVKISQEIELVKSSLSRIQTDSNLKISLQNLQNLLQKYAERSSLKPGIQIQQYVLNSNKMVEQIFAHLNRDAFNSISFDKGNTFQKQFQQLVEEQRINLKEKYHKSQYQVTLAKKHLAKLKQYCENLQKKQTIVANPGSTNTSLTKKNEKPKQSDKLDKLQKQKVIKTLNQRLMQTEAQNEALKQNYHVLKQSCDEQINSIKKKFEIRSVSEESVLSTQQTLRAVLANINEINENIIQYIKIERQNIQEMKENNKKLKNILTKPMQSFQMLAKEVSEVGVLSFSNNLQPSQANTDRSQVNTQRSFQSHFSIGESIKNYKQILSKRNQNYQTTNKLMTELIRTVRQNNIKQLKEKLTSKKQDEVPIKRSDNRIKNIERKMKEMQNQKLKEKLEMIQKIEKIQQNLQKINGKLAKSINLKATLNKFQANLDSKINQIVNKTQIKLDKSEVIALKEQVIVDLKSKLQEANTQSQGLRKQMSILYAEKKQ